MHGSEQAKISIMHYNEIPILEFDNDPTAVISPTHEDLSIKLPPRCVFAFLGEYIDEYASNTGARKVTEFLSTTKNIQYI